MVQETANGAGAKDASAVERRSVLERPLVPNGTSPTVLPSYDTTAFWFASAYGDEIIPWGTSPKTRDKQLRNFVTEENIFGSALGIICQRNAAFRWVLDGPERTASRCQKALEASNLGEGWVDLIMKISMDLYTQDHGAFIEIVRETDSPDAPFIGLNHLDAAKCWHTGNIEAPVIYQDRLARLHLLKAHNVITLAEMPTPIEIMYGMQYCTLSRLLRAVQVLKSINILKYEKTSGRNSKSIELVRGITTKQMNDAIDEAQSRADSMGLTRYMKPILVGSMDPKAEIGHDTIALAGLPDDYDEETTFKQYINQIAMAFASDYQEFAPLPGGNLGTSAQSEVLHLKNRGKGPAIFMKLITEAINFRVLPQNIEFRFDEQDIEAEKAEAEVSLLRAQTRAARITSGEITVKVAQQIAQDQGDLDEEMLAMLEAEDETPDVTIDDQSSSESQIGDPNAVAAQQPLQSNPVPQPGVPGQRPPSVAPGQRALDESTLDPRGEVEDSMTALIERGFNQIRGRIESRLLAELGDE